MTAAIHHSIMSSNHFASYWRGAATDLRAAEESLSSITLVVQVFYPSSASAIAANRINLKETTTKHGCKTSAFAEVHRQGEVGEILAHSS